MHTGQLSNIYDSVKAWEVRLSQHIDWSNRSLAVTGCAGADGVVVLVGHQVPG